MALSSSTSFENSPDSRPVTGIRLSSSAALIPEVVAMILSSGRIARREIAQAPAAIASSPSGSATPK